MVDSHLRNALPYRFHISWIPQGQTSDSNQNTSLGPLISKPAEPAGIGLGLVNLNDIHNVSYGIHTRKMVMA